MWTHPCPTLGCAGGDVRMSSHGSEAQNVGAFGSAQWDQVVFCGAGGAATPPSSIAGSPCQPLPRHMEALPNAGWLSPLPACQQALPAWQGQLWATPVALGLSPGTFSTCVGPGCALPGRGWNWWWSWDGGKLRRAEGACTGVWLCACACMQGHQQRPCHHVPSCAELCQEQAEWDRFLLVMGRNRPPCSGVTHLWLLCWGCPVQPCPMSRHRAGHRGTQGPPSCSPQTLAQSCDSPH